MKKIIFIVTCLFIATCAYSQVSITGRIGGRRGGHVPPPMLLEPISEVVDLSGKDTLEFRWSPHEGRRAQRRSYDFRLYKGYNMIESTLILKRSVPPGKHRIYLDSGLFESGQIYTWSLRQV